MATDADGNGFDLYVGIRIEADLANGDKAGLGLGGSGNDIFRNIYHTIKNKQPLIRYVNRNYIFYSFNTSKDARNANKPKAR